ncbi:MAG: hydantoinase/oxoprolinase family protein [Pseudomonadota bacterium]
MRIGVDVGGTNTDAVVVDGDALVAAEKRPTSDDIAEGVIEAVRAVLASAGVAPEAIDAVMLGTTQFTNAVVRRRDLAHIGALRVGAQSSRALPIGAKWPKDLASVVIAAAEQVDGGAEFDGAPIVSFDAEAARAAIDAFQSKGAEALAITSLFSPVNADHEIAARNIAAATFKEDRIALSNAVGGLGLYQRENATLLNAALLPFADRVVDAFAAAFSTLDIACPFFISQNDGTLMTAAFAKAYPVLTFSSGPTNSMRGAAFLTGARNAMVVDIGGTTSDIGMLIDGYPRPSGVAVEIGGVLTNFRMPDVLAVGLGGGSIVADDGRSIGPDSVGAALRTRGLVFGGDILTASDAAIAAGRSDFGDVSAARALDPALVNAADSEMRRMLGDGIDRMKTSADALPLIVVGGGAFLAPDDLPGVSHTLRPENAGVANAIGAAFAQIGAEAEIVYVRAQRDRNDALAEAKAQAIARAVDAGADPEKTDIAHIEETPMSYLAEGGSVIKARAVGDVDLTRLNARGKDAS